MEARSSLKGVLLDFDGTLVDLPVDWDRLREDISHLFAAHGIVREFRPLYVSVAQAFGELEAQGAPAPIRAGLRRSLNHLMTTAERKASSEAVALPGSRELLEGIRVSGLKAVIQTSNSVLVVREVWNLLSLPPVDAVAGREGARRPKPHPEGVLRALRGVGLRGSETVVIGDGDFDVQVGRAIGALTIRVGREGPGAKGHADHVVGSLTEAGELLGLVRPAAAV